MDDPPASTLGEIIRRQRELSELSMRQFARMAGISNPYLSQIERGLRDPSEKVLEAIASSLQVSADALYEQAGMVEDESAPPAVVEAIRADTTLTGRQRQALIEVYEAFAAKNGLPPPRPGRRRRAAASNAAEDGAAAEPAPE
jgi:transcriptional regulator with XRE-family HTH domain